MEFEKYGRSFLIHFIENFFFPRECPLTGEATVYYGGREVRTAYLFR